MRSIQKASISAGAAAFAFVGITAIAQPLTVKEDQAQLAADKAALERQLKRLHADEATLEADAASGKMSAESKDAYGVYQAKQAVTGEAKDIISDRAASLQMKADEAALQHQIKRLEVAEARLKSDTQEGKMSAMSDDSERVYRDRQAVKAEATQVTADAAKLKADWKK